MEKADFICQLTGPAGQFWQMESALSLACKVVTLCDYINQLTG